jgi:ribosome maturation factor RimP
MNAQDRVSRVQPLVEAKLTSMGMELVEMKFIGAGAKSILRLYIDRPGGVTIDDCARVSTELSVMLDVEDIINHAYSLEVSSPGADRLLTAERDFARNVGRQVRVTIKEEGGRTRDVVGDVLTSSGGVVTLSVKGSPDVAVPIATISYGKIEFSFK